MTPMAPRKAFSKFAVLVTLPLLVACGDSSGPEPTADSSVVGRGLVSSHFTSDLWLHGNVALTGTWGTRGGNPGDRVLVWDITAPDSPVLANEVVVDAGTVNDVKIRDDGLVAVITHENSVDELNGITILDLANPLQPTPVARFTDGLEAGVHNVWIDGDYVYVAVDGPGQGMRVVDITDPADPQVVASFTTGVSFLHDIYVRDGLAFLSYWAAGLIILDVGNGIGGGSPENPIEIGRVLTTGGETHNAWYWPAREYVFVGEEDFDTPGIMHVVDASDLTQPREVATFAVTGDTPHNFWLDETRGILYMAWYSQGIRALDVTGELSGQLELQGRELAFVRYGSSSGCASTDGTCTWAPQLHQGKLYVSDLNTGLWVLDPP